MELIPTEPEEDVHFAEPVKVDVTGDEAKPVEEGDEKEGEDEEKGPVTCMEHVYAIPANFLKQADQNSPLVLVKMPKKIAFTIAVVLFGAYLLGFIFQLAEMYGRCDQDNNCVTCAITNVEVPGSDCSRLADTQLNVRSGCMTVGLPNEFDLIKDILANTKKIIENSEDDFTPAMYESLTRHGDIIDTIQKNTHNQMIDPSVDKLRDFFKDNFFGLSNAMATADGIDSLDDSVVVGAGLKVLYSYITLGCALHSQTDNGIQTISGLGDGLQYTYVTVCGCSLYCPTDMTVVAGSIDAAVPDLDHGLSTALLAFPDNYVQTVDTSADPGYDRKAASLEFQYFTVGNAPKHCSNSVFTSTPSSLNSVLFECCTEKTNLEKLSETSAFAGLVMTFAVVATTIVFWPWSPKSEDGIASTLRGNVMELLG
jgi:hypothetical protein